MAGLTALTIASLIAAAAAAGATGIEQASSNSATRSRQNQMRNWIRAQYPDLSPTQVDALVSQYGDEGGGVWDIGHWGDQSDWSGLRSELDRINKAYDELGDMPQQLSLEQLLDIENQAKGEIDAENRQLFDLYDQSANRANALLQNSFADNQQGFADYRNQILTNNAMQQQAIAGSTRYELQRSQRNAIIRGASAAQRLVESINTSLGMQAKSAQQSLDTSNALAQQLLAYRQAQTGLRSDYMNQLNQQDANRANVIRGSAERKANYAQSQVDLNINRNEYARDAWNNRTSDYFSGDSVGEGIYRNRYGTQKSNNSGY